MDVAAGTESLLDQILPFFETKTGIATLALAALIYVFAWCRLFSKAGFHGALGLLTLVPPLFVFLPLFLAFASWPADRELRGLRRLRNVVHKADERTQRLTRSA